MSASQIARIRSRYPAVSLLTEKATISLGLLAFPRQVEAPRNVGSIDPHVNRPHPSQTTPRSPDASSSVLFGFGTNRERPKVASAH